MIFLSSNKLWLKKDSEYLMRSSAIRPEPVLVDGKGCWVTDVEGRSYLDFTSGQMCASLGHCHPAIVEAIKRQTEKLIHTNSFFTNVAMVELAEKLSKITPQGLIKSYFLNTGSESNEVALKIAKIYTGRWEFISLHQGFLGLTQGCLSLTNIGRYRKSLGPLQPGCLSIPAPYCYRCSFKQVYPDCDILCADYSHEVISRESSGAVAAWISEPILSAGGLIIPPDQYFKRVKDICREYNLLLILDEAQTGFGRTGRMFACEHYGIIPDIMTVSKTLGGGIPISAAITTNGIAEDVMSKGFFHITSHTGDPLVCAAAAAGIDVVVEDQLPRKAQIEGEYLMRRLQDLKDECKLIGDVRGKGLMIGVELVEDKITKKPAYEKCEKVISYALEHGLIIGLIMHPGVASTIRILPPLTIKREEIDKAIDILKKTIREAER